MKNQRIIFIVGPTAVGKTDIALCVAQEVGAEIISCDAMQVYREINIASNKPPKGILKNVPHHLLNVVSTKEEFDVAAFNALALKAMQDIHGRNKLPLFTGGSGMYMEVLLDGIFPEGNKDIEFRRKMAARINKEGPQGAHAELEKIDPRAAGKIHFNDAKRIIRALEVFHSTGRPISQLQNERKGLWGDYDIFLFALNRPRAALYERINERVEMMVEEGLVEEIKKLNKIRISSSARSIIGIEEVRGFLNKEYDLDRAKYLMQLHTRHYAKRQLTWLRREKRLQWIMIDKGQSCREVADRILINLR